MIYLKYMGIAMGFSMLQIVMQYLWGDLVLHTTHYYWADQFAAGAIVGFWIFVMQKASAE